MNHETLSERQKAILKFIQLYMDEHGYPPTIRDIGEAVKIASTSVVNYNLNKLVKEGFITRSKEVSRGIRLITEEEPNDNLFEVKMAGKIVAGAPTPVPENDYYDDRVAIPRS